MITRRTLLQIPLLAAGTSLLPSTTAASPPLDLSKRYGGVFGVCCAMLYDDEVAFASKILKQEMLANAREVLGPNMPISIFHLPFDRREFNYGDCLASYEYWGWNYDPSVGRSLAHTYT